MKAIVAADGTTDLKKYGLDKPQALATLGAGSTRATLAIGGKKDDDEPVRARSVAADGVHGREDAARRPQEEAG